MSRRVAVICGPTASGKTALSVALAQRFDGEVVSADSMQLYRRMDIGTAKPTAGERRGIPHHMLDVADPGEPYSVARYVQEATACVEDILSRGKLPIVCGGTGLYIDGLLRGTDFQPNGGDTGLRQQLEEDWERHGPAALLERLAQVDPESAARLHPADRRRILRALEVYLTTGETITAHNARTRAAPPRYEAVSLGLNTDPRQLLYDRIDRRVGEMLERGLLREVESLWREGLLEGTAAQAIGYKELLAFLRGEDTLEAAADRIRQKSRNYAKRQLTWFRRDPRIRWIVYNTPDAHEAVCQEATDYLRRALYNV